MERIVVQTRNKEKARLLVELLAALDFIDSVEHRSEQDEVPTVEVAEMDADFFALAGLWEGREITQESIRYRGIRPAW